MTLTVTLPALTTVRFGGSTSAIKPFNKHAYDVFDVRASQVGALRDTGGRRDPANRQAIKVRGDLVLYGRDVLGRTAPCLKVAVSDTLTVNT